MLLRRFALAAGLLAVVPAVGSFAQESPAPTAPPSAPAERVLLKYRFQPGQVQRFRSTTQSEVTVTPDPVSDEVVRRVGWSIVSQSETATRFTERAVGIRKGAAVLRVAVDGLHARTSSRDVEVAMTVANGKTVVTQNGRSLPPAQSTMANLVEKLRQSPAVIARLPDGTSEIIGTTAPGLPKESKGGYHLSAVARFPAQSVAVGDHWETVGIIGEGTQGPIKVKIDSAVVPMRCVHTLREIQVRNGHRIAVVASEGSGSGAAKVATASSTGVASPTENSTEITGVTWFDIDRGTVVRAELTWKFSSRATVWVRLLNITGPFAATLKSAGGLGMWTEGKVYVAFAETPAPAAPAPKKQLISRSR